VTAHCETLALQADVEVKVEFAGALPPIQMDRPHMVQVFKNLVANAIQHSPRRGVVCVRLEDAEEDLQRFTVRDRGKGFAERSLERIFEPFYSERRGGVGLGLSIVQRFVIEQGGSVRAFNHSEGGAVVEVILPHGQPTCPETCPETGHFVQTPDRTEEAGPGELERGSGLSQRLVRTETP